MKEIICSIIIPVYNGEKFIEKTINSCLEQSIAGSIEIIAVDDCSSDSSLKILRNLELQHPNIFVYDNAINLGISKSVNKSLSLAKGEYVIFLGHDDLLRPNHLDTMISEFDYDTSFVHCNADLIDSNDIIFGVGCIPGT